MPYFTPIDVPYAASARSDLLDSNFNAIQAGFNLLPTDTDLKRGTTNYATDTGSVNAYVVALPNAPASYTDGLLVTFKTVNASTGPSTINVNGLGNKAIKTAAGADTSANDILGTVDVRYNTTTGFFHLVSSAAASAYAAAAQAYANAAALSASGASSSQIAAAASAALAAGYAASLNLPLITGNALKVLRANAGETAIEYATLTTSPFDSQEYWMGL